MNILPSNSDGLYTPTIAVSDVTTEVAPNIQRMRQVMEKHNGVGLAATQVGVAFRFFIYGGRRMGGSLGVIPFAVVVNPRITWRSELTRIEVEGCLSFPGQTKHVERAQSIRVDYLDYNPYQNVSRIVTNKLITGYFARLFQHETDHLDGVCIFDRPKVEEEVKVLTEAVPA